MARKQFTDKKCSVCRQKHLLTIRYSKLSKTTEWRLESDEMTVNVEFLCPVKKETAIYEAEFEGPVDETSVEVVKVEKA